MYFDQLLGAAHTQKLVETLIKYEYSDQRVFLKVLENKYLETYKLEGLAYINKSHQRVFIMTCWTRFNK